MLDGRELSKLNVRREARGSGIAQSLLTHAEQSLAGLGVATAELFLHRRQSARPALL